MKIHPDVNKYYTEIHRLTTSADYQDTVIWLTILSKECKPLNYVTLNAPDSWCV